MSISVRPMYRLCNVVRRRHADWNGDGGLGIRLSYFRRCLRWGLDLELLDMLPASEIWERGGGKLGIEKSRPRRYRAIAANLSPTGEPHFICRGIEPFRMLTIEPYLNKLVMKGSSRICRNLRPFSEWIKSGGRSRWSLS